jgi:glyoxylase-like metal-dependent hydrolase (beta-lactamase superfamily II)
MVGLPSLSAVLLALAAVAAAPGAGASPAATSAAASAAPERLAADTWWLRGAFVPGRQPDGNSVLLRGPEGLVVVDSGRHAAHGAALLAFAAAQELPVVAVVNTHWHLDHVSGNPALRAAHPDLAVHASDAIDAALEGFLARYRGQLQAQLKAAPAAAREALTLELARIDAGAALRPDVVVRASGPRTLAGRPLQLGLAGHAATAGDVWLFDPATGVLAAGDLVTLPAPFLDTACPAGWQAALAALEAQPFRLLVPGHGAPLDRDGFARWRRAFDGLLQCAAGEAPAEACATGWIEAAGPLLAGHPEAFTRDLLGYYVQHLRGPQARAACPAAG